ncbi:GDP-fucose protein O-fucosyltransferase 1-like isoform X2 [Acanthaster planci]|uniref:GDP-fucose protein O-fucosyltransferase 1 n=1 Tax=Acanthaster planci TaxID=133434 RepID=A0A8B7YMZ7_ACAPL|nr:GDP-fucose protein O-fucosyltransferase 1-like isoform X2 [Acanthaster planci]
MAHLASFAISLIIIVLIFGMGQCRNVGKLEWESSKGYLLYCPCSGRYGNQLEQLMGALLFSSKLGRVLVIPPFIMYPSALEPVPQNAYVQIDEYFELDEIKKFYPDVITMEDFMTELAPLYWKQGNRIAYCSNGLADINNGKCTRDGNPFRTFWEDQGIEFDDSAVWTNLYFNVEHTGIAKQWKEAFPASEHPVLALVTAPVISPISTAVEGLQHYLKFKSMIREPADEFIENNLPKPFWGLHLRNGADWSRTCDLLSTGDYPHLLSSRQCTSKQGDSVTREMCLQSEEQVITDIRYQLELAQENNRELPKSIYVATDHVAMEEELQTAFPDIKIVTWGPDLDQKDLFVLTQADDVILNCVSAFSAFVKRDRDVNEKLVAFFGYLDPEKVLPKVTRSPPHEEL